MPSGKSKEPPMVHLNFPEGSKVELKGFKQLTIDRRTKIILEGTVKSVSKDEYEWDKGRRFSLKMSKCTIEMAGKDQNADDFYPKMKKKG